MISMRPLAGLFPSPRVRRPVTLLSTAERLAHVWIKILKWRPLRPAMKVIDQGENCFGLSVDARGSLNLETARPRCHEPKKPNHC